MDIRMRTRDGRDVETSWANIRLSDGTQVGIGLDITDRKRFEESLKEADRRKDEFLATLAHELRNPLAPLRNGLHVMKLAAGDAKAVEQARRMMERQLSQMVRLIDDLLDVSRITRGKLDLRKERVDLASVIQSAGEGSRPLIEASGHRLTIIVPSEPIYLDADPTRLAQVFGNLLTNATKYTDKGGHIGLTAERHAGEVTVSVKDTGIGIAAEHLPRLFQMFSQVAPALERSQGGLGIGLSLVKGLVEMHGGRVEARSEGLGKGSEFVVHLPVLNDLPARPSTQAVGREDPATRRPKRILVADDNRDTVESLAILLRLQGHEVQAVHDGQEAVRAAERFQPDLALLDIGMPRLNGFDAARRIREQSWGKRMMLVAISGWGQEEDKQRATEAGFDYHLTKPVDPDALERLLAGCG
jgi:signal transduction histidine kinase/CheY-like chemotaxis protein